jgi:hypothetical protein
VVAGRSCAQAARGTDADAGRWYACVLEGGSRRSQAVRAQSAARWLGHPEYLRVICVSRRTLDGNTVRRVSGLARRISSLCHECEQVGLAVSIDTLSQASSSALSFLVLGARRLISSLPESLLESLPESG